MTVHAKYRCSIINNSEDMSQVIVFVTNGQTEGQMDEWVLMSPRKAGTIKRVMQKKYNNGFYEKLDKSMLC